MLSVIIPSRDRSALLCKALESLTKQTIDNARFEVIVIDNGSTDNTRDVVKSFENRLPNLRYFYEDTPGLQVKSGDYKLVQLEAKPERRCTLLRCAMMLS